MKPGAVKPDGINFLPSKPPISHFLKMLKNRTNSSCELEKWQVNEKEHLFFTIKIKGNYVFYYPHQLIHITRAYFITLF